MPMVQDNPELKALRDALDAYEKAPIKVGTWQDLRRAAGMQRMLNQATDGLPNRILEEIDALTKVAVANGKLVRALNAEEAADAAARGGRRGG